MMFLEIIERFQCIDLYPVLAIGHSIWNGRMGGKVMGSREYLVGKNLAVGTKRVWPCLQDDIVFNFGYMTLQICRFIMNMYTYLISISTSMSYSHTGLCCHATQRCKMVTIARHQVLTNISVFIHTSLFPWTVSFHLLSGFILLIYTAIS